MTPAVLVTGAGSGIGWACAQRLVESGCHLFAGVRSEADALRVENQLWGTATPVQLDVTDAASVATAAKLIEDEVGELHGVVNNAGIARGGPIEYISIDDWRSQFEVNVFGQVAVTKAVLPLLRRGEPGRVVFVGSLAGRVATNMLGPYSASKHAIEAVAETLRQELHPWGIGVSVIEPGAVRTGIWHKARETTQRLESELPPEALTRYRPHVEALTREMATAERDGIDADVVAKAVEHALFAKRARHRYPVGLDSRLQSLAVRVLPDRGRDALLRYLTGPRSPSPERTGAE
ncbi:SDR family oxidoreductase [Gordonia paraffinivorans]|uniref:SDR family oxidoreductase n=1 Tax=Gordonia paraffinivorans TaxID=175628 RepID=UPI0024312B04|nr:SDR family oxidoreductase [Gordonia paraffinivorans]